MQKTRNRKNHKISAKLHWDDIVYKLQNFGGISLYWNEVTSRIEKQSIFTSVRTKGSQVSRYLPVISNADIFHSSYYRLALSRKTKVVITVYDFLYELGFIKTLGSQLHIAQKKLAIKNAAAIICISENTRNDLLSFYGELVNNKNIYVIGLGCSFNDLENQDWSANERITNLEKATNHRYILFVGNRNYHKNFNSALLAFASSVLPNEGYSMVCTGSNFSGEEKASIEKLGIQNKVFAFEYAKLQELKYLYQHSLALVYPSAYEGFGLPPLEAMICGCPVIASNTSSLPEVVGDAGILVNPQDINQIITGLESLLDQQVRNSYVIKGKVRAKLFSWEESAHKHIEVYKSLISNN